LSIVKCKFCNIFDKNAPPRRNLAQGQARFNAFGTFLFAFKNKNDGCCDDVSKLKSFSAHSLHPLELIIAKKA
jgi:hypothetical protein